jgi:hypothetical protein
MTGTTAALSRRTHGGGRDGGRMYDGRGMRGWIMAGGMHNTGRTHDGRQWEDGWWASIVH